MENRVERSQTDFGRKWLARGKDALERGRLSEAVESLKHALEADSQSIEAHLNLGIALAMDAHVYEAIDVFEAALALSPNDFMVNFKLAELYFGLCVPEKGHRYLRTAMEACSNAEERQLLRALMSQESDREKRRIYRPTFVKS